MDGRTDTILALIYKIGEPSLLDHPTSTLAKA
jgi:hypothetical protein